MVKERRFCYCTRCIACNRKEGTVERLCDYDLTNEDNTMCSDCISGVCNPAEFEKRTGEAPANL